jgi:hypothetical protein
LIKLIVQKCAIIQGYWKMPLNIKLHNSYATYQAYYTTNADVDFGYKVESHHHQLWNIFIDGSLFFFFLFWERESFHGWISLSFQLRHSRDLRLLYIKQIIDSIRMNKEMNISRNLQELHCMWPRQQRTWVVHHAAFW